MPQKWLSVRQLDYERCKTKSGNSPWVKFHRALLNDPAFISLTPANRFLYIGLIFLATESGNKVYADRTWIGQRLYIRCTEIDLTPLYRAGLLETSNLRRLLREREEREGDREREGEAREQVAPARKVSTLPDEDWLHALKSNPAYQHIDISAELGKMDAWLSTQPGRMKSRRFIVNWLNKVEKPVKVVPIRPAVMSKPVPVLPPGEDCPPEVAEKLFKSLASIGGKL
jgi:hypothetical protein